MKALEAAKKQGCGVLFPGMGASRNISEFLVEAGQGGAVPDPMAIGLREGQAIGDPPGLRPGLKPGLGTRTMATREALLLVLTNIRARGHRNLRDGQVLWPRVGRLMPPPKNNICHPPPPVSDNDWLPGADPPNGPRTTCSFRPPG